MSAYYNEHDPFAAAWLRELIADGLIAPGEVDERSIEDVRPDELAGFVQCHFFAGIGVWSLALRQAGWPDSEPIWTGSCPCQPFSAAGKGGGFDDERHLWPAFHWLIEQSGAPIVFGEQVASKDGLAWLNLVSADLEATGYAFGAVDTCAAGFGAPHIRQRLYWMADAQRHDGRADEPGRGSEGRAIDGRGGASLRLADAAHDNGRGRERRTEAGIGPLAIGRRRLASGCDARGMADSERSGLEGHAGHGDDRDKPGRIGEVAPRPTAQGGSDSGLADANGGNASTERQQRSREQRQQPQDGGAGGVADTDGGVRCTVERPQSGVSEGPRAERQGSDLWPGPLNGLWRDADWLCCTDGKWRPVAPGTFPLAPAGTFRNRVGLLRGAGNAINLAQAQGFIEAVMEVRVIADRKAA